MSETVGRLRQRLMAASPRQVSIGYRTVRLFSPEELEDKQLGYSRDPSGRDLTGQGDGDWLKSWIVIGHEDMNGDPLFTDLADAAGGVYTAAHGMGTWTPTLIAESFEGFVAALRHIQALSQGRTNPIDLQGKPLNPTEASSLAIQLSCIGKDADRDWWTDWFEA